MSGKSSMRTCDSLIYGLYCDFIKPIFCCRYLSNKDGKVSSRVRLVQKKAKCIVKGIIRKSGDGEGKIYIIIGDKIYFVSVKTVRDVLNGNKEKAAIRGFD
jgi:hypothetical protein